MKTISDTEKIVKLRRKVRQLENKVRSLEEENRNLFEEMAERGKTLEKVWTLLQGGKSLIEEHLFESLKKPILEYVIRCSEKNSVYYNEAVSQARTLGRKKGS